MKVLSTLALMGAMRALAIDAECAPTVALLRRLRGGEDADVAILTAQGVDELIAEGVVLSRTDVALSYVGLAVKAGARKPDIGSVEAFTATLLAARSIAYSRIGASGIFFAGLIERLGIADAVNAKACIVPSGFTAELAVSGEVELAVQQVSELLAVPGIELVGKLPPEIETVATFSAGQLVRAQRPDEARALLQRLASPEIAETLRQSGLEPAG